MARYHKLIIILAVLMLIGGVFAITYRVVHVSLDAEATHQAYLLTLDLLTKYVQETVRWPTNWDELAQINLPERGGMYQWPKDAEKVSARVKINFLLRLNDIVTMTPENFSAVLPASPNYGTDKSLGTKLTSVDPDAVADDGGCETEECLMNFRPAFPADAQPPKLMEPTDCAFDEPANLS
jgi:hypothetical protein